MEDDCVQQNPGSCLEFRITLQPMCKRALKPAASFHSLIFVYIFTLAFTTHCRHCRNWRDFRKSRRDKSMLAFFQNDAGQAPSVEGARIDIDSVCEDLRLSRWSMAVNDNLSKIDFALEKFIADP